MRTTTAELLDLLHDAHGDLPAFAVAARDPGDTDFLSDEGWRDKVAELMSALANRRGGGLIVFGVDTDEAHPIQGIDDLDALAERIDEVAGEMVPAPSLDARLHEIDGESVLAVVVSHIPRRQGSCYHQPRGRDRGCFRVVGTKTVPWSGVRSGVSATEQGAEEPAGGRVTRHPTRRTLPPDDSFEDAEFGSEVSSSAETATLDVRWRDVLDTRELSRVVSTACVRPVYPGFEFQPNEAVGKMRALRIIAGDSFDDFPTLAGMLAFGTRPDALCRGASLLYSDRRSGRESWCGGPIAGHLRLAPEWVRDALPQADVESVRELLVNAFVHRSWEREAWSVPVQMLLYGDRVEIVSPGEAVAPRALGQGGHLPAPVLRNPVLADLLRRRGLCQGLGRGLTEVRLRAGRGLLHTADRGCGASSVRPLLIVTSRHGEVRAVLTLASGDAPVQRSPRAAAAVDAPRARPLLDAPSSQTTPAPGCLPGAGRGRAKSAPATTHAEPSNGDSAEKAAECRTAGSGKAAPAMSAPDERARQVLALLRERGVPTTRQEIEEALGWSRSTLRDVLSALVRQGIIEGSASSSRSPRQAYSLAGECVA